MWIESTTAGAKVDGLSEISSGVRVIATFSGNGRQKEVRD